MIDRYNCCKDEELRVLSLVYEIRKDHPTMGIRDMYFKIRPEGMGRDAFEEFCKRSDLSVSEPKNHRRTTDSSGVQRFDNLIENLNIEWMNQAWQSDITYYEVNGKFYYLTFILDSFSRRILGHQTSKKLYTEDTTLPALKQAIKLRGNKKMQGLIFHSDGGGQYYDKEFLRTTKSYCITNSMCEFAWQNGKAERINGVIKNNYLNHKKINNYQELVKEVDRSVYLYNMEKPHIELQRKSPVTFETEILNSQKQTKPTMKKSLYANQQILGVSNP